jgi:hypothetical protein
VLGIGAAVLFLKGKLWTSRIPRALSKGELGPHCCEPFSESCLCSSYDSARAVHKEYERTPFIPGLDERGGYACFWLLLSRRPIWLRSSLAPWTRGKRSLRLLVIGEKAGSSSQLHYPSVGSTRSPAGLSLSKYYAGLVSLLEEDQPPKYLEYTM